MKQYRLLDLDALICTSVVCMISSRNFWSGGAEAILTSFEGFNIPKVEELTSQ